MDMIEKVAKALCESTGTIWGGPRGENDPDFYLVKAHYMNLARVAVETIALESAKAEFNAARAPAPTAPAGLC